MARVFRPTRPRPAPNMSSPSPMLGRPTNDRSRNAGARRQYDAVGGRAARAQPRPARLPRHPPARHDQPQPLRHADGTPPVRDGALPETELVVRRERDLEDLDDAQSGLALIKSWAAQGWLHRIVDERAGHDQNVCYLTQDARRALDFLRGMRRQDTIPPGGPTPGIAARHVELDQFDAGQRPHPDVTDCYD